MAGVAGTLGRAACSSLQSLGVIAAPVLILVFAPGFQEPRHVRSGGRDAALDLPVSVLHLPHRARRRRAQQLRALRGPRLRPRCILNIVMIVFAAWIAVGSEQPGADHVDSACSSPASSSWPFSSRRC